MDVLESFVNQDAFPSPLLQVHFVLEVGDGVAGRLLNVVAVLVEHADLSLELFDFEEDARVYLAERVRLVLQLFVDHGLELSHVLEVLVARDERVCHGRMWIGLCRSLVASSILC